MAGKTQNTQQPPSAKLLAHLYLTLSIAAFIVTLRLLHFAASENHTMYAAYIPLLGLGVLTTRHMYRLHKQQRDRLKHDQLKRDQLSKNRPDQPDE